MKYFVTGGAGFVGCHLVRRLLASGKDTVSVYDNLSTGRMAHLSRYQDNPKFRFIRADLLDFKALVRGMKGQDCVFHLAANSDIMRAMKSPALDYDQGIRATFHVLEAMRIHRIKKLVYLSGSGIYGDFGKTFVAESSGPLNPQSMYGAAKLASEAMIAAYSHLYGMRALIFRPANIIGPNPTHGILYDLIQKLKKNPRLLPVLGDGRQSKSYLHIEDFLNAVFFVLRRAKGKPGQFNVASETYIDVRSIAKLVVREMGLTRVRILYSGKKRGWVGDVPVYRLSIKKIKALGWKPQMTSRDAVIRTIREILQG